MIAEFIADYFQRQEWMWKTNQGHIVPNVNDVAQTLDKIVENLYDEVVGTQLSTGRLIVRKDTDNQYDVYMLVGTIDKD